MANHPEQIVDGALRLLAQKRTKGIGPLSVGYFEEAASQLEWKDMYRARVVHHLAAFMPDRADLLEMMRERWKGIESKVALADVTQALSELARRDLRDQLIADSMPPDAVEKAVQTYSFGLLVHA